MNTTSTPAGISAAPMEQGEHLWRSPAAWVMTLGMAYGGFLLWDNFSPVARVFTATAVLNLFLLVVTLLVGTWLARRFLRPVQAPAWTGTWLALAWGGLAAIGISLTANTALQSLVVKNLGFHYAATWGAATVAPFNEETAKVLGVMLMAAGTLLPVEAEALSRRRRRSAFRKHHVDPGRPRRQLAYLQQAQLSLLEDRTAGCPFDKADKRRRHIVALRDSL